MRLKKSQVLLASIVILALLRTVVIIKGIGKNEDDYTFEPAYQYDFGVTLNLEDELDFKSTIKPGLEGTDFGNVDDISEYEYVGEDLLIYSDNKQTTVALSWKDEGYAKYVEEPQFGVLVRSLYSSYDFSAKYEDVSASDAKKYIKNLNNFGFVKVLLDKSGKGYMDYSAENADGIRATVNYEDGEFTISVF